MFCDPENGTGIIVLMNGEPKKSSFEKTLSQRLLKQVKEEAETAFGHLY
jgi:hypothetical protein